MTAGARHLLLFLLPMMFVLLISGACSRGASVEKETKGQDGAPMALISGGDFSYGDNNQEVSLPDFYMDKYEVTAKLYAVFLHAAGRRPPQYWAEVNLAEYGNRPVVWVTWDDAEAYCRWAGKRLPTEQEWEKAARGTDERRYPWGNDEPTPSLASFDWDGRRSWQGYQTLAAVDSYEEGKSPYGLYNMAGNVWEWTSSDNDSTTKVIRGGAWLNVANDLRTTHRAWRSPTNWNPYVGFRCVQNPS